MSRRNCTWGDTESGTCVIWVESEEACRTLIETVWSLIHEKGAIRPEIYRAYPLAQAGEALAALGARGTWGKVVLEP